jgi:divalent metal cation (Fe/Co/Zn/Cd) transporter
VVANVRRIVESDPSVRAARTPLTMHLGPSDVLLNLDVEFIPGISAGEQVAAIARIEDAIRSRYPGIQRIFIEAGRFSGMPGA